MTPSQDLSIHFQAGMQHLSGEDAVKVPAGGRTTAGKTSLWAMWAGFRSSIPSSRLWPRRCLSLGTITKIGDIVDIMNRNLESNLNYGEMIWFGEQFLLAGDTEIRFHNLPGDYTGTLWSQTYQNYQSYCPSTQCPAGTGEHLSEPVSGGDHFGYADVDL